MPGIFEPQRVDPKRWVLAAVLAMVAAALLVGGVQLAQLGGSPYYIIGGVIVAACAYFTARGDARGRRLYGALLVATLLWALWERGLNPWALQARVFAPAVLGIWVFLPALRRWPRASGGGAAVIVLLLVWVCLGGTDPVVKPSAPVGALPSGGGEWAHWGGDMGGMKFSPLAQITPENVGGLKEKWRVRIGDKVPASTFENTPLMVNSTLYVCTPASVIVALDPESGERRWTFDPKTKLAGFPNCRGVAYYVVPGATGPCSKRIIFTTFDTRLMAIDADDGAPCRDFGDSGTVDQTRGLGPVKPGYWVTTSAPVIVRGKVIFNAYVSDNQYVAEPSGVIRAYDAVTGQLVWAWDMDRPDRKGEPPQGEIYTPGTASSWAPMSADEDMGLVFLPMGNATPDAWAAHRSPASEKYGSSVVALDVDTGDVRWSFQTVHHDTWDYDVASQPTLVDLTFDGGNVPALIQPTKRGQVFVLDRRTGLPLTDVEERPVPQGAAPGDHLSPTQPFSVGMPVFDDTVLSEQLMWGLTPLDQLACRIKFKEARYEGPFTPVGVRPTVSYPGYMGGMNWWGVSVDPERKLMVVNWNRMPYYTRLIPRAEADALGIAISETGRPRANKFGASPQLGTPFAEAHGFFLSLLAIPCMEPPFGMIGVVDLNQRRIVWQHTLGTSAGMGPLGMTSHLKLPMGMSMIGGTVTTRAGLIFVGATLEREFRAFDVRDGRKLWATSIPEAAVASPLSYLGPKSGKQFIAVAAGGRSGMMGAEGEYIIAYGLP